ncbi:ABC transporter permease [Enterococcus sp. JM9B]|uniref:ABC transporter permease n=1 Tax=Enterococcus sp. JM9B TaxID=1857216 RepID=UPI001374F9E3|nr:ABC transporter permease [Enterococcus sp. JM9B]KAF1303376.1 multidrug ABC transporter permease [Enterococcus sp. JM9B]
MSDLFQKRLQLHQKQMMKYLRYVFNDHFVLVCTFLLGGLGLYYSDLLKTLPKQSEVFGLLVLLVWLIVLHFGKFVSLTKAADLVFLLPKEKQMRGYLQQGLRYSCFLPFVVIGLIAGITMPLAVVATGASFGEFFLILPTLWLLKIAHLYWQRYSLFFESKTHRYYWPWLLLSGALLATSLYLSPIIGLLGSLLVAGGYHYFLWQQPTLTLHWEKMIQSETNRLHRIYQFINLFTDVPEITASVKRRKYLDGLLKKITAKQENTYLYLYARRMVRGSEYSGLYMRLVLIGGLLLYFIHDRWFSLGIGGLFLYLIGFQLMPLYTQFRYMVLTHLYPVSAKQQSIALQRLLLVLLIFAAVVFAGVAAFRLSTWGDRGIVILGYGLVVGGFIYLYLPSRLKKMNEK